MQIRLTLVAAALATTTAVGFAGTPALAQTRETPAEPRSSRISRLGTHDALVGRVNSAADLARMGTTPATQRDISTIMDRAGLTALTAQVIGRLSAASTQALDEVHIAPGTRLEWMAFRDGRRPRLQRHVEWAGAQPFEAFQFRVDHGDRRYTFVVPKACGNLALLDSDAIPAPPPPPPPPPAPAASEDRLRLEREARERQERERQEAERRAAEEAERARRETQRLEEERLERERQARERVDWFVAGFFGKERRVRELDAADVPNAAAFNSLEFGQCSPLLGIKGGVDVRLSPQWRMAPALGVAFNLDEGDQSSVFAEVEFNRMFERGYLGTGIGAWDFNHSDTVAASWLLHAGREVYRAAGDHRLFLVAEGRLFLGDLDDIASNYQFWAGLRYVVR